MVSGGVLTERTVGEVLPALQSQIENITKVSTTKFTHSILDSILNRNFFETI